MSKKYLDDTGLSHFWDKIKAKISGDISAEAGKMIPYGYCQTAKGTVAKTVTVSPAVTEITTGLTIAVRFQYENTSSNPTLNVNGLGAKAIKRYGSTAPSTSATGSWNAGSVNILTYNGSYWMLCDWNNTTYSGMTDAEVTAGTGTSNRLITPARLKGAIEHWATGEANVQSDWGQTDDTADDFIKNKPTIPSKTSDLTNDSGFVDTSTLNGYATIIGLSENYQSPVHTLVVNGSTATLYLNSTTPTPIDIFAMNYLSVAGVLVAQVLNGATDLSQAQARVYEVAEVDITTASVRLVSVDNGVIYTADLQDTGNGLTGTFSSQTIPTSSGGEEDIFIATYDSTSYADILSAYNDGKVVFCKNGSTYVPLTRRFSDTFFFIFLGSLSEGKQYYVNSSGWSYGSLSLVTTDLKINGKKLSSDITLTASDVGALPNTTAVPTKTSDLTNDSGFIAEETDPTVPAWAKASTKPSYNSGEIGFSIQDSNYIDQAQDVGQALYMLDDSIGNAFANLSFGADEIGLSSASFQQTIYANDPNVEEALITTDHVISSLTATDVGALPKTGGQVTGDITLYVASGNSPAIIFQRGTLTDNYNDWKIYDKSGFLYFAQRGSGSSAFGDVGYINTSGVAYFHVPWSYIDSKPTFATVATSGSYNDLSDKPTALPTVTSSDNGKVLRVVNGAWSAVALPSASGVSF